MKFGGWIEWRVKNRSRCFACTFLLILPLNIHTYIYIYRHTHIKYRASKLHDDLTFGARSNTYTPQHTHAHTTFRQFRQFLDMYRYFSSLSSAYCSTYRYVLLLNLQTPPFYTLFYTFATHHLPANQYQILYSLLDKWRQWSVG